MGRGNAYYFSVRFRPCRYLKARVSPQFCASQRFSVSSLSDHFQNVSILTLQRMYGLVNTQEDQPSSMKRGFYNKGPRAHLPSLYCSSHSQQHQSPSLHKQSTASTIEIHFQNETSSIRRGFPYKASHVRIAMRSTILLPSLLGLAAAAPRAAEQNVEEGGQDQGGNRIWTSWKTATTTNHPLDPPHHGCFHLCFVLSDNSHHNRYKRSYGPMQHFFNFSNKAVYSDKY